MVKDRIIELDNGINYYILEEISYKNKKYILAVVCNLEEETVDTDKFRINFLFKFFCNTGLTCSRCSCNNYHHKYQTKQYLNTIFVKKDLKNHTLNPKPTTP